MSVSRGFVFANGLQPPGVARCCFEPSTMPQSFFRFYLPFPAPFTFCSSQIRFFLAIGGFYFMLCFCILEESFHQRMYFSAKLRLECDKSAWTIRDLSWNHFDSSMFSLSIWFIYLTSVLRKLGFPEGKEANGSSLG